MLVDDYEETFFEKRLQGFVYWGNYTNLRGRTLEFNTFQAADKMDWYTSDLVDNETDYHTKYHTKVFETKD